MPAASAMGRTAQPQEARRNRRPAGERERERDEAGRAARLRQRDEVGEVREHERPQLEHEHDHRPTEHERGPAPPRCEPRERDEHESGERDRAAAGNHPRREVEALLRVNDEVVRVVPKLARLLRRARVVRERLGHDRLEPREDEQHGHAVRGERHCVRARIGSGQQRTREREADERDGEEERVRRVDEREIHPGRGERERERPRRRARRTGRRASARPGPAAGARRCPVARATCRNRRFRERTR